MNLENCQNPNPNSTQHKPKITLVWLDMKMTLQTTPPHPPPTPHINSMPATSQLLLTWFWWNFKYRFLGTSTDFKCNSDICPGNICPSDIYPYQEYLSCYWPDFEKTLKEGSWEYIDVTVIFVQAKFVVVTFVNIRNISAVTDMIWLILKKL